MTSVKVVAAGWCCALASLVLLAVPTSRADAAALQTGKEDLKEDLLHGWQSGGDPAAFEAWTDQHLRAAQASINALLTVTGPRTLSNTLRPFDQANNALSIAGSQAEAMALVHPDQPMRDMAQSLVQRVASAVTALNLNHDVYEALSVVPQQGLDAATRYLLERTLLEYRLLGVDRGEAVRTQVEELQDRMAESALEFQRTIASDTRTITLSRAELDGLPADYLARHSADAQGNVVISLNESDVVPVQTFATSAEVRRRIYLAYGQRAYPANKVVLLRLLKERYEFAQLLGYTSFAQLDLSDQMMGSSQRLNAFLDEVDGATRESARHEYARLLRFAKSRDPALGAISESDRLYWLEQYRRAVYDFDAQSVRSYFPYEAVRAGVLKVASRLFHIEFKAVAAGSLWDPSVLSYDVIEHGKKIGRIYLDMHPREGKDKSSESLPLVPGIRGQQLPEGMLVCNFAAPQANDPALMQYSDVVLFLHEFGHLMHHILGGQGEWSEQEAFNVERDFVEAPSQMLEELFRDPKTLEGFAKRSDTQEPIPQELVLRMNAAATFGRAMAWQRQLLLSNFALRVHDQNPASLDLDAALRSDAARFSQTEPVEGSHRYASLAHLADYGPRYYSYVLDKVIALDFFNQFERTDPLDGSTALRYRRAVLDPGASKPAEQLVNDFLGRTENIEAFKDWLSVEFQPGQPGAHPRF